MIQVKNLSKSFLGQTLFDEVTFTINKGERIGLVGRNGSGKSTLFSMMLGGQTPDDGEILVPKNYRIGHLEQHLHFTKETVIEECCQVLVASTKSSNQLSFEAEDQSYKAKKILFGLGFTKEDLEKNPLSFSGGYQIRMNLCKSLLKEPQLLLLDEPTNYLDILSMRWLKTFLNQFDGEVIIITHDRSFMDSITTHTMGFVRKKLRKIPGSTKEFYEKIKLEDEQHEKTKINLDKKKAHLENFIERFGAKASKATQAQSRVKQLAKLESLDDLEQEAVMIPKFQYASSPGKILLQAEELSFAYANKLEKPLFSKLSLSIAREDRIGIIGKNGHGKSTLLNVLAQEFTPLTGSIKCHPSLAVGHLGQTNVERLNPKETIIEAITDANPNLDTTSVRQICGSMMFPSTLANKKISVLSGGEKNRVLLGKILARPSNLLFLDEPTNHLDMESIDTLVSELKIFPGAVVIVTHSEEILHTLVNKLVVFRNGNAELFLGSYQDFLDKIGWEEEKSSQATGKLPVPESHARTDDRELKKENKKELTKINKEMTKIEDLIVTSEAELKDKEIKLEESSLKEQHEEMTTLCQDIADLHEKINAAFMQLEVLELEKNKKTDF